MKAKRLCAWCGKFLGWGETQDGSPTHGICDECAKKMEDEETLDEEDARKGKEKKK